MSKHKPIAVGILGLGRSGWDIHARAIRNQPDTFRLVAVHDPIESRRQEAVRGFECKAYGSPEEVMKDPEVKKKMDQNAFKTEFMGPEESLALVKKKTVEYETLLKELGRLKKK